MHYAPAYLLMLLTGVYILSAVDNNDNTDMQHAVYQAAEQSNSQLCRLLTGGGDINARDEDSATALITATEKGKFNTVCNLIAAGADVNLKDSHGESALMKAATKDYAQIVEALLSAGADCRAVDTDGKNALDKAIENHSDDSLLLLYRQMQNGNQIPPHAHSWHGERQ